MNRALKGCGLELKFRAWDKEQKCLLSWDQLMDVKYNERWFADNQGKNYINCIFTDSDFILMPSIVRKDKAGKDIEPIQNLTLEK